MSDTNEEAKMPATTYRKVIYRGRALYFNGNESKTKIAGRKRRIDREIDRVIARREKLIRKWDAIDSRLSGDYA